MAQPHTATDNTLQVVTAQPTASPPPVQRKVSIANDVLDNRYDNLAFEPCSKRKGSQVCWPDISAMLLVGRCYVDQVDVFISTLTFGGRSATAAAAVAAAGFRTRIEGMAWHCYENRLCSCELLLLL